MHRWGSRAMQETNNSLPDPLYPDPSTRPDPKAHSHVPSESVSPVALSRTRQYKISAHQQLDPFIILSPASSATSNPNTITTTTSNPDSHPHPIKSPSISPSIITYLRFRPNLPNPPIHRIPSERVLIPVPPHLGQGGEGLAGRGDELAWVLCAGHVGVSMCVYGQSRR